MKKGKRTYKKKEVIISAFIIAFVSMMAVTLSVAAGTKKYVYVTELERPERGTEKTYNIDVMYDGDIENLDVPVRERALDAAELEELYREAESELERLVLGDNESFGMVLEPVELVSRLDRYNMDVKWYIEDWNVIDYMGQIYQTASEQKTHITAQLTYKGRVVQEDEGREYVYEVIVQPYTDRQIRRLELERLIESADEERQSDGRVLLPEEYKEKEVLYRMKKESGYQVLVLLIPVIVILLAAKKRSDMRDKKKKTEEVMISEYPDIISKLSLLIGAGMTPYNALSRIAADGKGEAYRRITGIVRRIQSGASEREQYSQFGRIFGVYCYSKLGTMLEQNAVRGNEQLRVMLRSECTQALEERKARARKKGEQAGTKMLFPMLLMLLVVMVIIMVPAFMSF